VLIYKKEGFFHCNLVSKFINIFFFSGLKESIEKIIYFTFKFLKRKLNVKTPLFYFFECIEHLRPILGLKKKLNFFNIVKKTQYITYYLKSNKSYNIAITWFYFEIKLKKKTILLQKIFNEIVNLNLFNLGISLQRKYQHYHFCVEYKNNKNYRW